MYSVHFSWVYSVHQANQEKMYHLELYIALNCTLYLNTKNVQLQKLYLQFKFSFIYHLTQVYFALTFVTQLYCTELL